MNGDVGEEVIVVVLGKEREEGCVSDDGMDAGLMEGSDDGLSFLILSPS